MEEILKQILSKLDNLEQGQKTLEQGQKILENKIGNLEQGQKALNKKVSGIELLLKKGAYVDIAKLEKRIDALEKKVI